jgi:uncharacterized protein YjbJ (UPF0337 family)
LFQLRQNGAGVEKGGRRSALFPNATLLARPNTATTCTRNHEAIVDVYFREAHRAKTSEDMMDWNRVEGNWKQVKGKVKEKWGQLTDDDLDRVNGKRDQLEGKIQERYGIAKDMVRKDIDDWLKSQH